MTITADFDAIDTDCSDGDLYLGDQWNGLARALLACKDVGVALDAGTFTLSSAGVGLFGSSLTVDDTLTLAEAGVAKWALTTVSGAFALTDSGGTAALTVADSVAAIAIAVNASGDVDLGAKLDVTGVAVFDTTLKADDNIFLAEAGTAKWDLNTASGAFSLIDSGGNAALTIADAVAATAIAINADGDVTFGVDASVTGVFNALATANFTGAVDMTATLQVDGDTTIGDGGASSGARELIVDSQINLAADVVFKSAGTEFWRAGIGTSQEFTIEGSGGIALSIAAAGQVVSLPGTLAVVGAAVFDSTVEVDDTLYLSEAGTPKWEFTTASGVLTITDSGGNAAITVEDGVTANAMYVDAAGHVGFGADPGAGIDFYVAQTSIVLCRFKATDNSSLTFEMDAGSSASQTIDFSFADQGTNHYKLRSIPGSSLFRIRDEISTHNWMDFTEGGGVQIGAPTGADNGQGTLNAVAVYDDNVLLTCYVADAELDGNIDLAAWDARVADRRTITDDIDPEEFFPPGHKRQGDRKPDAERYRGDIVTTTPTPHAPARAFAARAARTLDPKTYDEDFRARRALLAFPTRDEWDKDKKLAIGDVAQRLWEEVEVAAIHRAKLLARIEALENA